MPDFLETHRNASGRCPSALVEVALPEENRTCLGIMASDFSKTTLYEPSNTGFVAAFEVTGSLNVLSTLHRRF